MPPPAMKKPPVNQASANIIKFGKVDDKRGHRVLIYGPGGIGKTTLACVIAKVFGPAAMVDADESLPILKSQLEAVGTPLPQIVLAGNFKELRGALQSSGWDGIKNIITDSVTKVQEWATAETLKTVPHEKGHVVSRIEDYGYGKGYQHVFDVFLPLLGDYDRHIREGRNVILIAHECVVKVPNPNGEDWIRYEPRLQSPSTGNASIRHRIKEWADHVLFVGYDIDVKEGKAKGSNTRTMYCNEMPHCMAKSRTVNGNIDIADATFDPWNQIIK